MIRKEGGSAKKYLRGQSLFEVLLALAIITITIVAIASLSTYAVSNTTYSRNKNQATRYAQEGIEWVRNERDKDVTNFLSKTPPSGTRTWCINDLEWPVSAGTCGSGQVIFETQFTRNSIFSTVTDVVTGKKVTQVEVKVSWNDSKNTHEVSSTTYFSDWRSR